MSEIRGQDHPYRFTDPDGRYTCGGDKEFCAKIDSYISALRDSARALREGGASKRDEFRRIRSVLAEIGERGKGGPNYVPGTVVGRASAHTDQHGTTTVQVSKIANAQQGAQIIGHEATHDIDVRTGGLKNTEAQVRETETNAYSTSRAVDMGFGIIWTQSQFDESVEESVRFWRDNQPKQEDGE